MPALVTPACGASGCEVGDALRLASKAHVLDTLHLLAQRAWRFNALRSSLRVKASVLSARLKDLGAAGLVTRREVGSAPVAVEYAATEAGVDLLAAIEPLQRWALRHGPSSGEPLYDARPMTRRGPDR